MFASSEIFFTLLLSCHCRTHTTYQHYFLLLGQPALSLFNLDVTYGRSLTPPSFFRASSSGAGDQGVVAAAAGSAPREAAARDVPGVRRLLHRVLPGRHLPRRLRLWQEQRARVPGK